MDLTAVQSSVRYGLAVLFLVAAPPAVLYWFLVHPFHRQWQRLGIRASLTLIFSLFAASTVALFLARKSLIGSDLGFHWPLAVIGILLYGLSVKMELQTRKQLSKKVLMGLPELDAHNPGVLLTEGSYERSRNPRYLGMMPGFFGFAFLANYTSTWILAVATLLALQPLVLLEERELRERYGASFDEYCKRVPRWVQWKRSH